MKRIFLPVLFFFGALHATSAQIPDAYYDQAEGKTGDELKTALGSIIKGHTKYPYSSSSTDTWDILKKSDKDPDNEDNVILFYTGWSVNAAQEFNDGSGWNREHVWVKSRGDFGTSLGPGTDAHHLRPTDISVNAARDNRWYDTCSVPYFEGGINTGCFKNDTRWTWQPRDEVKGDAARMIFYMATRYEGENGELDLEIIDSIPANKFTSDPVHAKLSALLLWHQQDPVDEFEWNRNEVIYSYQNNRNPFIDHPEYADAIWGPDTCEMIITHEITNAACPGECTASISVAVSGGYPPHTYNWSTGESGRQIHELCSGYYGFAIQDSRGCLYSDSVSVDSILPPDEPVICCITADTSTEYNLLVWHKESGNQIAAYNVYRETYTAGVYQLLGTVPFHQPNVFLDTQHDPGVSAAMYVITAVDSCGSESAYSNPAKSVHLFASGTHGGGTSLQWDYYGVYGVSHYISTQELYKSHCHPLLPSSSNPLTELSYDLSSFTDNDPTSSKRKYQYRLAGKLNHTCPVWDHNIQVGMHTRAFSSLGLKTAENPCDEILPSTPTALQTEMQGNILVLRWERSMDKWEIEKYNVYNESGELLVSTIDSFYLFTDLSLDSVHTFSVSALDWNYNESEKSAPITFSTVGISKKQSAKLTVYPNPFTNQCSILFSNPDQSNYTLILRDIKGNIVMQINDIRNGRIELYRDILSVGMYFIEIRGQSVYRSKLLIE